MEIAPVLFLIFNRPNQTRKVFEQIKLAKPRQLFIAADGPRKGDLEDNLKCRETRSIVDEIDWECEVKTLFRDENLGCGRAVSQAITWFFEQVEMGIILEDDCLPDMGFFSFSTQLLDLYEQDQQVFHISGFSWIQDPQFPFSYYFMNYPNIWGWATWRNRWMKYNYQLDSSYIRSENFSHLKNTKEENYYHDYTFKHVASKRIDTWDYQWKYTIFCHAGLCITPNGSLITNIGLDSEGTHTTKMELIFSRAKSNLSVNGKREATALDSSLNSRHRDYYLWPKANYFFTKNSTKESIKTRLPLFYELLRRIKAVFISK